MQMLRTANVSHRKDPNEAGQNLLSVSAVQITNFDPHVIISKSLQKLNIYL